MNLSYFHRNGIINQSIQKLCVVIIEDIFFEVFSNVFRDIV